MSIQSRESADAVFVRRPDRKDFFGRDFKFIARAGKDDARRLFLHERRDSPCYGFETLKKQVAQLMAFI